MEIMGKYLVLVIHENDQTYYKHCADLTEAEAEVEITLSLSFVKAAAIYENRLQVTDGELESVFKLMEELSFRCGHQ